MTWNYRVIHRVENGVDDFAIHEVYYESDKATFVTVNAISPGGETLEELRRDFEFYQKALLQPVLEYDSFDQKDKTDAEAG